MLLLMLLLWPLSDTSSAAILRHPSSLRIGTDDHDDEQQQATIATQMPPPPYDPGAGMAVDQLPVVPITAVQPRPNLSKYQGQEGGELQETCWGSHQYNYSSTGTTRRPCASYVAGGGGGGGVVGSPRTRPEFDFGRAKGG
ncbi:hypothetical protein GALMADRAFT_216307 [Galerina marginata CBS 339.88]|uniref:Uncharacterized protein n=1 Tax=Galerina marginata (strain CBS 339.88) TaxID=685588 RepID=A0A067SA14_GALM3|nr:hypothetical protein GALMADRAFT_216307 [Galerina marginata CBS 339.88]